MKTLLLSAAIALLAGTAAMADPLVGTWHTANDDNGNSGLIKVKPCGPALCGTLIKAFDKDGKEKESDNIGRKIIWDTKPVGDGEYRGMVYAPDRDKEYKSKLILNGDNLSVSGCVVGICREGGVWKRVK